MEGDGPTVAFVLPHYYQIKSNLLRKEKACAQGHPFHPMYWKIIPKLEDYLDEALECETLIMATHLHPTFQLRIFHEFWPESENDAKQLLEQQFNKKDAILKKKKQTNIELLEQDPNRNTFSDENDAFARFNAPQSTGE